MQYRLCTQTVTVYRRTPTGVQRTVLPGCGYFPREAVKRDMVGARRVSPFLLIVPGDREILPDDRVLPGEGPEISNWEALCGVPAISGVRICYWGSDVCHREGSGE